MAFTCDANAKVNCHLPRAADDPEASPSNIEGTVARASDRDMRINVTIPDDWHVAIDLRIDSATRIYPTYGVRGEMSPREARKGGYGWRGAIWIALSWLPAPQS